MRGGGDVVKICSAVPQRDLDRGRVGVGQPRRGNRAEHVDRRRYSGRAQRQRFIDLVDVEPRDATRERAPDLDQPVSVGVCFDHRHDA